MVATLVLGACVVRRASSSLALGTNIDHNYKEKLKDCIFSSLPFVIDICRKMARLEFLGRALSLFNENRNNRSVSDTKRN